MSRESNKPLLKNVVAFISWLRASCKGYLRWEPASAGKRGQVGTHQKVSNNNKKSDPASSPQDQQSSPTVPTSRRKRPCLKCGSDTHRVKECPQVQPGEAEILLRDWRERRTGKSGQLQQPAAQTHSIKAFQLAEVPLDASGSCVALVENEIDLRDVLLDSGADVNVVSRGLVKQLHGRGIVVLEESRDPRRLATFDGKLFNVTQMVRLDTIQIQTTAGPLLLRRTPAWVFEHEAEKTVLILSRPVMERLGYSVEAILARACDIQEKWDLQNLASSDTPTVDNVRFLRQAAPLEMDPELRADTPELAPANAERLIAEKLAEHVSEAAAEGLGSTEVARLRAILLEYRDVFCIAFGNYPPIRVEPLRVRMCDGATSVRVNARRYPPAHMEYFDQHIQEPLDHGLA